MISVISVDIRCRREVTPVSVETLVFKGRVAMLTTVSPRAALLTPVQRSDTNSDSKADTSDNRRGNSADNSTVNTVRFVAVTDRDVTTRG